MKPAAADECWSTQLIDAAGEFNADGLARFVHAVGLADRGLSYAVVAIIGPQGSGKSTLLNHLFGTNFREMDALKGRSKTTIGIWIAKAVGIEPCTVVMDLEGTDGRERGEDDIAFEKQSALFALAISDIVLINMWCHDIGREHAANKPLLKTIFQVMMHLFSPRKTTLMFVIRDKTKTPLESLEAVLREDIQKIWDTVHKPQARKDAAFSEFFNVGVTALPSYEEKELQFKEQVAQLRQRFFHSITPGGLAGDRQGVIPASGFSYSIQQIWKVIRENRDLDLPAHKVMVATIRCEEIANEKLSCLTLDKGWLELKEAVQSGPVSGFGKKLCAILDSSLLEYDMEAIYFDEGVRTAKRQQLESRALDLVHPAFQAMLGHLCSKALNKFKYDLDQSLMSRKGFAVSVRDCTRSSMHEFDCWCADIAIKYADWDTSKARENLQHDIEAHAASLRSAKLSELKADYEKQLAKALAEPVESLFDSAGRDTWVSIRKLYKRETEKALSSFSASLSGFELDQATFDMMMENLKHYGRNVIEMKAREEAGRILIRMKERFSTVFSHDSDSMPIVWTGKEDIRLIAKNARASVLELLSVMAAIRLDDKPDKIENILKSTLLDSPATRSRSPGASLDPLASSTWEEIPPKDTLITPVQCKSLWRQFKIETEYTVIQAISAQEAHRRNNNWSPWAILLIAVLGFNEFVMLWRNPLYLMLLFVLFLVSRALWYQLDILGIFRKGKLSGLLALLARFLQAVRSLLRKLDEVGQEPHQAPERQPAPLLTSQSFRSQSLRQTPMSESLPALSSSTVSSPSSGVEYTGPLKQVGETDTEASTS